MCFPTIILFVSLSLASHVTSLKFLFQTERDGLIQQREDIAKRLESNECLLREKEDEVFLNLERVVYLEEQCDKVSYICNYFFTLPRKLCEYPIIYNLHAHFILCK